MDNYSFDDFLKETGITDMIGGLKKTASSIIDTGVDPEPEPEPMVDPNAPPSMLNKLDVEGVDTQSPYYQTIKLADYFVNPESHMGYFKTEAAQKQRQEMDVLGPEGYGQYKQAVSEGKIIPVEQPNLAQRAASTLAGGITSATGELGEVIGEFANRAKEAINWKKLGGKELEALEKGGVPEPSMGSTDNIITNFSRDLQAYGEQLTKDGMEPGLVQKIISGIGRAAIDIPALMATGGFLRTFGLGGINFAVNNAMRASAQGADIEDTTREAMKGLVDQKIFDWAHQAIPGGTVGSRAAPGTGMAATSALGSATETGTVSAEDMAAAFVTGALLPPPRQTEMRPRVEPEMEKFYTAGPQDVVGRIVQGKSMEKPVERTRLLPPKPEEGAYHGGVGGRGPSGEELSRPIYPDDNLFLVDKSGNVKSLSKAYDAIGKLPDVNINKGEAIMARQSDARGGGVRPVTGADSFSPEVMKRYIDAVERTREQPGEIVTEADVPTYEAFTVGPKALKESYEKSKELSEEYKISKYRLNTMEKIFTKEQLKEMPREDFAYQVQRNEEALRQANDAVQRDLNGAMEYIKSKDRVELDGFDGALDVMISRELAARGDIPKAKEFAMYMQQKHTKAGQFNQALAIADRFSPERILQTALTEIYREGKRMWGNRGEFERAIDRKLKGKNIVDIIPDELAKRLIEESKRIDSLPEGAQKDVKIARVLRDIANVVPVPAGKRLATLQTMSQLLNIKTKMRNSLGNAGMAVFDMISQALVGRNLDVLLSKATGRRSIAGWSPKQLLEFVGGYWEGRRTAIRDVNEGIDTSGLTLKRMLGKEGTRRLEDITGTPSGNILGQHSIQGMTFKRGKILPLLEKTLSRSLRVPDRAAFWGTLKESLYNQTKIAGVKDPTSEMIAVAITEGLTRTYQDPNKISQGLVSIKKGLNKTIGSRNFGLGDIILKYPMVPGALLARGIEATPIGILSNIRELTRVIGESKSLESRRRMMMGSEAGMEAYRRESAKLFARQRRVVSRMSRGVVGSVAIAGLGAFLASMGLVTGSSDEEKKVRQLKQATGEREYNLNLSALMRVLLHGTDAFDPEHRAAQWNPQDILVSYDWFQPLALPFSVGVDVVEKIKSGQDVSWKDPINFIISAVEAGANTLAKQPLLTGVTRTFKYDAVEGVTGALRSLPSTFIPTLLSQIRYFFDPKRRDLYEQPRNDVTEITLAMNKIPGLSRMLPKRVNVLGEEEEIYRSDAGKLIDMFNIFVSPTITNKYMGTPATKFLLDLYAETGETKQLPRDIYGGTKTLAFEGGKIQLTPEERADMQGYVGKEFGSTVDRLINEKWFKNKAPQDQVEIILGEINDIAKEAREMFYDRVGRTELIRREKETRKQSE